MPRTAEYPRQGATGVSFSLTVLDFSGHKILPVRLLMYQDRGWLFCSALYYILHICRTHQSPAETRWRIADMCRQRRLSAGAFTSLLSSRLHVALRWRDKHGARLPGWILVSGSISSAVVVGVKQSCKTVVFILTGSEFRESTRVDIKWWRSKQAGPGASLVTQR